MIRFAHIFYLYGLLLIPVFVIVFWAMIKWRKKVLDIFGESSVISQLMPDISKSRPVFKFVLLLIAYFFLIIGIADPQVGSKFEKAKRKGVDLVIALDVSNSMLARDIQPDRLTRAKQAISKLIDNLDNDRISIIVFAGKPFVQLPMTSDYAAAKMFVSTINTEIMPVQGTAIGSAMALAEKCFGEKNSGKRNRALIIITDGENHEDDAVSAAKYLSEEGIFVHTIGMGSADGAPIPLANNRFKTDKDGNTIVTKLDEVLLQQIAAAGNGIYVRASTSDVGLSKIFDRLDKMDKTEYESKLFSDYEDRFQYFIGLSLIFLFVEVFIFERKNKLLSKINPYSKQFTINK